MSIMPRISRKHLDKALQEGRDAAAVAADETACPYLSQDQLMTRHAWLKGFLEITRRSI